MDIKQWLLLEQAIRTLEDGKILWETKEGKRINIHDRKAFTDSHLNNCIRMIEHHEQEEEDEYLLWDDIGINDMDSCIL